jgi:hypothetical protein
MLQLITSAAQTAKVAYAIGGAIAMRAHGYERSTQNVDIFVEHDSVNGLLYELHALGVKIVPISTPSHYAVFLRDVNDSDVRIDILVPEGDPELSAIRYAETKEFLGVKADVFPLDLLVFAKFYVGRPKDELDIIEMLTRGLFDPAHVSDLIGSIDKGGARDFDKLIKSLTERRPARVRSKRRLPPRG